MTHFERLEFASRTFCIAAILGLSLAIVDTEAIRGTLLLAAVSATALAADIHSPFSRSAIGVAEGALVALVVGASMPQGLVLLPYLVIPSLVVGLASGGRAVLAVVGTETVAIALVVLTAESSAQFSPLASALLPWLLTSLGVGLLCAWLRETRHRYSRSPAG